MILKGTVKPVEKPGNIVGQERSISPEKSQHVHVLFSKTSWPVSVVWTLLSFLVALTSLVSLVQPEWLVREQNDVPRPFLTYDPDTLVYMLGLYGVCYKDTDVLVTGSAFCFSFEGSSGDLGTGQFPSTTWRLSFLLFGSGCVLFTTSSLFAILSLGLFGHHRRRFAARIIGHAQGVAVLLQLTALLVFPWALGTPFAEAHCGPGTGPYQQGRCRLGWASVLAIISTLLGVYCPLLARFTTYRVYTSCPWELL